MKRTLWLFAGLPLLGFIFDLLINNYPINTLFNVDGVTYSVLFGAIITISISCISILGLIIGLHAKKIFGFGILEIMIKAKFNLVNYVVCSFSLILFSVIIFIIQVLML